MPTPDASVDQRYFSVISWPDGSTPESRAALLARDAGFDEPTYRMLAARSVPCAIQRMAAAQAIAGATAVCNAGGEAFAPSTAEIAALGPTRLVRTMSVVPGGFVLEPWREPAFELGAADIDVIVRADLSEAFGRSRRPPPIYDSAAGMDDTAAAFMLAWGFGGAWGMAAGIHPTLSEAEVFAALRAGDAPRRLNLLDVHTTDGRVFQINGTKFGFQILGERRALTDNRNIDLMCELITTLRPEAIVDPYFSITPPAPHSDRFRLPGMAITKEVPQFAFYSRWAALMYRHLTAP